MRSSCTAVAAAAILGGAGCVAEPSSADAPADADVVVIAEDVYFEPERIEVPAGQAVTLHLRNDGGIVHDLVLDDGWETGHVDPGAAVTVNLPPQTEGTIGWCSIPGHRDAGMELEIVVVDD